MKKFVVIIMLLFMIIQTVYSMSVPSERPDEAEVPVHSGGTGVYLDGLVLIGTLIIAAGAVLVIVGIDYISDDNDSNDNYGYIIYASGILVPVILLNTL